MRTLIVLVVLLVTSSVYAADVTEDLVDIPPGPDNIVVLKQGETAPFTGQLYDNPTAFRWAGWLMQYKLRLSAGLEYQRKLCETDTKLAETKLELEKEKGATLAEDYSIALDESGAKIHNLENPPFFRTAWFGFTMGVVVSGIAIATGGVLLASH